MTKKISLKDVPQLRAKGYRALSLHNHTFYSPDVAYVKRNSPQAVSDVAFQHGIDFVALTDHDTIDAHRQEGLSPNVIAGVELEVYDRARIGHPVHMGILNAPAQELQALIDSRHEGDISNTINQAHNAGATVIMNHPWWAPKGYHVHPSNVWDLVREFHLPVELNSKRSFVENMLTRAYAKRLNVPIIAADDTHTAKPWYSPTFAKGETIEECLKSIRHGDCYYISHSASPINSGKMVSQYIHDVFHSEPLPEWKQPVELDCGIPVIGRQIDRVISHLSRGNECRNTLHHILTLTTVGCTSIGASLVYVPYVLYDGIQRALSLRVNP